MKQKVLSKLFDNKPAANTQLYAIVDCAATSGIDHDDDMFRRLSGSQIVKFPLMSGEAAWANERVAPFLLPLDPQPELSQWLMENCWGKAQMVFLAAEGEVKTLLSHLKRFFEVRAENGRNLFFRFYDPVILRDFLSMLSDPQKISFFGPVRRYVLEDEQGRPLLFDRPTGEPVADPNPSQLVTSQRSLFSAAWNRRLTEQHKAAYQAMGLAVHTDPQKNRLVLEDKDGGRAVLQKTAAGVTVTTGEDRVFKYELSMCKNPTAITDPAGSRIEFDLQERENVVTRHSPTLLNAIRMENNRKRWVFDYDDNNHLSRIDYPDGANTQVRHDAYGHLNRYTDRNGNSSEFERDHHDRHTRTVDANGNATVFEYDDSMAPARIRFADGADFAFSYSDQGRLKSFLANNEKVADYHVDPDSGSWRVAYTDGTQAEFVVENGKIVRAKNPTGTLVLGYDENGRLLSESFNQQTVSYQRNQSGLLTGIRTPDGKCLEFARDGEQRIGAITDWRGRSSTLSYARNGALEKIAYPNGVELHQATLPGGLPEHMTLTRPATEVAIFNRRIKRDLLDRVLSIRDGERSVSYSYDPEGRLLAADADRPELCERFTLDAKANRLSDHRAHYHINAVDRIQQTGFAYDAIGNQTRNIGPQGAATYHWQSGNRLAWASVGTTCAHYSYDAFGRRVEKLLNGVRIRYIWAGAQLLQEIVFSPEDHQCTDYLFFPGTPALLSMQQDQRIYYAAFGHRYETLCLTDHAGQVAWQAEYDTFGNAHITTGAQLHQPMRLCGHYLDPETGLHYCSARYYDPHKGRYLSLDPLFVEGGGDNYYAYCNGDPINRIDPTGEFIFVPILIGAAVGALIGAGVEAYRQHQSGNGVDGLNIARAALIGGVIGAVGGGVGAAVQDGATAGLAATAIGKSTVATMASAGFLSGAAASAAEQCTGALANNDVTPLAIAGQALNDGVIGAGVALVTLGVGGFLARRVRTAATQIKTMRTSASTSAAKSAPKKSTARAAPEPTVSTEVKSVAKGQNDHRAKATAGDPVYAVTGEVMLTQTDFTLPGCIPLSWTRHYGSQEKYEGLLGPGWQTPAAARLSLADGLVIFSDGSPGGTVFESLPTDAPIMEPVNGATLWAAKDSYQVKLKSGLMYHFGRTFNQDRTYVEQISDLAGNTLSFIRQDGALTRINDSSGQHIHIFCEHGRITAMSRNGRPLVHYDYNDGRLVAATDPAGHKRCYAYQDGRLSRHSDRNHLSFHYQYDKKGRCTRGIGDNGLYDYRFEYPAYERRTQVTNSLGHVWQYHYDADRQPVKVVSPDGGAIIYTYDAVGRVSAVTDALERVTRYDYDTAGNVVEITRPDDSHMAFVYDAHHRPVQIFDPNDGIQEHAYDKLGRLIEKASPMGHRTTYSYTRSGNLSAFKDPQGRTTSFDWDESGLIQSITDPSGEKTHYQHDVFGNLTAVIDPAGHATCYSYDEKSRLCAAVIPSGLRQSFEWDPEDNLLLHTDAQGRQTRFEYTGLNEIAQRINPDGTTVAYHYDNEERLTSLTNEKGQTHLFAYDAAGRTIAQTDYYGQTNQYHYDPAGQLIQSIDPLKRTIAYTYDAAGRMTEKCFESEERETFTWDRAGQLIAFESPDTRVERSIDSDGRLIEEKSGSFTTRYEYDETGLLTARTTSAGNRIDYTHDDGLVSAIRINDQPPVRFGRNNIGRITVEKLSEKLSRTHGYDEEGRLIHQRIDSSLKRIERSFTYDAAGNLLQKTDNHKGRTRYNYDPMGRIIESIDPLEQVKHYTYDPAGDLLELLPGTQALRSAVHEKTTYRFDAAGNLVEREKDQTTTRFAFDDQNRLRTVLTAPDTTIRMAYDALGRRRYKSVNGERTFFAWDGDALLAEWDEDNRTREYVYYPGTFEPLAVIDADRQVYYYQNDINGLPQELTRPNGKTVWSATYDALGRVEKILVDEMAQPLRMQGQYWDKETGLCYNRHRYFDPQICSFISQDPLGLTAGENVYAYAPNVWGWVDPLGLCKSIVKNEEYYTYFMGKNGPKYYDDPSATLGPKGGTVWMATLEDTTGMTSRAGVVTGTGHAPGPLASYLKGEDIYGVAVPKSKISPRMPTAVDAGANRNYWVQKAVQYGWHH